MNNKPQDRKPSQDKNNTKSDKQRELIRKRQEELLDEGIEETFPASDPVSVKILK